MEPKMSVGGKCTPTVRKFIIALTLVIGGVLIGVVAFIINGSSKNIAYDWGPWSACSSNGYMTRKQICGDTNCEAQEMQCYFFEPSWTQWSMCSNQSGDGTRSRHWQCGNLTRCIQYQDVESCNEPIKTRNKSIYLGDGYCDDRFNLPILGWDFDGGDCCGETVNTLFCKYCLCLEDKSSHSYCPYSPYSLGNKVCDDFANVEECSYDGGDCCNKDSDFSFCSDCLCAVLDLGESLFTIRQYINSECPFNYLASIQDGFCHDELNVDDCNYDGGDCCRPITITNVCNDCQCKANGSNNLQNEAYKELCPLPQNQDNYCNDELNIPECNYDDGACCGETDLSRCVECTCKDPRNTEKRAIKKCALPAFKGNGKCDDLNNILECDWDGGDCCSCYVEKGVCKDCSCKNPDIVPLIGTAERWCCKQDLLNNNVCDRINNNANCYYDALDCLDDCPFCSEQGNCLHSQMMKLRYQLETNTSNCMMNFTLAMNASATISPLCNEITLSDEICDLDNYFSECNFDGGDCFNLPKSHYLVLIGTGAFISASNSIIAFDMDGKASYKYPRFPKKLMYAGVADIDGSLYVCGGSDTMGSPKDRCYGLLKNSGTREFHVWQKISDMSSQRSEFAMSSVYHGEKKKTVIWATGGVTEISLSSDVSKILQVLRSEQYDPDLDKWEPQEPFLDVPVSGHCMIKLNESDILIAGGYEKNGGLRKAANLYSFKGKVTLTTSTMKIARKYHTCGVYTAKNGLVAGYAVGGIGLDDALMDYQLASMEIFYLENQKWQLKESLPQSLHFSSTVVIANRIFVMGGLSSNLVQEDLVFVHNIKTAWHLATFKIPPLYGHFSHVISKETSNIEEQPNFAIFYGRGSSTTEFEFICLNMNPDYIYCNGENAASSIEIPRIGAYIYQANDGLFICGGILATSVATYCSSISLSNINNEQSMITLQDTLAGKTSFSAYLQNPREETIITGGIQKSDKLLLGEPVKSAYAINKLGESKICPDIPVELASHCMVHVEDNYYFLAGGFTTSLPIASMIAFYWNSQSGVYMQLPNMKEPRANHVCIKMHHKNITYFVIGGGRYFSDTTTQEILSSTEIFNVASRQWEKGEEMPFPLAFASVANTDRNTYVFGGITAQNEVSARILTVSEKSSRLVWQELPYEMNSPRFGAVSWTLTHKNFLTNVSLIESMVPKSHLAPYDAGDAKSLCNSNQAKVPFCKTTHILTITGTKVEDFIVKKGKFVRSGLNYSDWPQDVSGNRVGYIERIAKEPAAGYVVADQFIVFGGKLAQEVTTHPINLVDSANNGIKKLKPLSYDHVSSGHGQIGKKLWIVGGLNKYSERISSTTIVINGVATEGPELNFFGSIVKLEGACVTSINDDVGFVAGGLSEKGAFHNALAYYFTKSFNETGTYNNVGYWKKLASIPKRGRFLAACGRFTIKDSKREAIFLAGGIESLAYDGSNLKYPFRVASTLLQYNIEENNWVIINTNQPLFGGTLLPMGDSIYYLSATDENYETKHFKMILATQNYAWIPLNDDIMNNFAKETLYLTYEMCDECLK